MNKLVYYDIIIENEVMHILTFNNSKENFRKSVPLNKDNFLSLQVFVTCISFRLTTR